jgi:hypothetical protein
MDALILEFREQLLALTENGFEKLSEYFQNNFDWSLVSLTAKSYVRLIMEQGTRYWALTMDDYILPGQKWMFQELQEFQFWLTTVNWMPILVALCCLILGFQLLERVSSPQI